TEFGRVHRLSDALGLFARELARPAAALHVRALAYLLRELPGDAREVVVQAAPQVPRLSVAGHLHQPTGLDPVRVRLDLGRLRRQLVRHAREQPRSVRLLGVGPEELELRVRIRERDLADVVVDRMLAAAPRALELDLDSRPMRAIPRELL